MLLGLGALTVIEGLAAARSWHFLFLHTFRSVEGVDMLGWMLTVVGGAQMSVSFGLFVRAEFSRWAGMVLLGLGAGVQVVMIPFYPLWALTLLCVSPAAIYGLVVYGSWLRGAAAREPQAACLSCREPRLTRDSKAASPPEGIGLIQGIERWPSEIVARLATAAQMARRTWNEWLAATCDQRDELYNRYVSALAEEERSAAALANESSLERAAGSRIPAHRS
jgi:hypothetical protein